MFSRRDVTRRENVLLFCTIVICLSFVDILYSLDETFITKKHLKSIVKKKKNHTDNRQGHILLQVPIEIQLVVQSEMQDLQ